MPGRIVLLVLAIAAPLFASTGTAVAQGRGGGYGPAGAAVNSGTTGTTGGSNSVVPSLKAPSLGSGPGLTVPKIVKPTPPARAAEPAVRAVPAAPAARARPAARSGQCYDPYRKRYAPCP